MQQRRSSLDETHPLTVRAALIGLVAVTFLTVASFYCDLYLMNANAALSRLDDDYLGVIVNWTNGVR